MSELPDLEGGETTDLGVRGTDVTSVKAENTTLEMPARTTPRSDNPDCNSNGMFICVYKKKEEEWRLRHAKVSRIPENPTRTTQSQPDNRVHANQISATNMNMDEILFTVLRKKLLRMNRTSSSKARSVRAEVLRGRSTTWVWSWKCSLAIANCYSWICQMFNPVTISGLEFWEVCSIHISDQLLIKLMTVQTQSDPDEASGSGGEGQTSR